MSLLEIVGEKLPPSLRLSLEIFRLHGHVLLVEGKFEREQPSLFSICCHYPNKVGCAAEVVTQSRTSAHLE